MGKKKIVGVNPTKDFLQGKELAALQQVAPAYYQYLMTGNADWNTS